MSSHRGQEQTNTSISGVVSPLRPLTRLNAALKSGASISKALAQLAIANERPRQQQAPTPQHQQPQPRDNLATISPPTHHQQQQQIPSQPQHNLASTSSENVRGKLLLHGVRISRSRTPAASSRPRPFSLVPTSSYTNAGILTRSDTSSTLATDDEITRRAPRSQSSSDDNNRLRDDNRFSGDSSRRGESSGIGDMSNTSVEWDDSAEWNDGENEPTPRKSVFAKNALARLMRGRKKEKVVKKKILGANGNLNGDKKDDVGLEVEVKKGDKQDDSASNGRGETKENDGSKHIGNKNSG